MRILNKKIHLEFKDGEIETLIALPSGEKQLIDKTSFKRKEVLDRLTIEKKKRAWNKIRRIEYWLNQLSLRQREAIFWRIINHDFEPCNTEECIGLKYKTLPYREIAYKMGINEKTVWSYVQEGIEKLIEIIDRPPQK
ncbi:RNA polymerase subunit sigma-24 [Thermosipho sp. 1074]|nr:RNA polymerase subunit sigma-24 [Thermosipho sp. 1074]